MSEGPSRDIVIDEATEEALRKAIGGDFLTDEEFTARARRYPINLDAVLMLRFAGQDVIPTFQFDRNGRLRYNVSTVNLQIEVDIMPLRAALWWFNIDPADPNRLAGMRVPPVRWINDLNTEQLMRLRKSSKTI